MEPGCRREVQAQKSSSFQPRRGATGKWSPAAEEEKFKPRRVAVSSQEEEPQESGARLQKRTSSRCEEQLGLTQNPSSEEQQELAQDPNS